MATTDVNTPASNLEPRTHIHHHCIVTKLMEINKSLFDQCKKQLRTTPFGWLLNLHCNIEASGRMLEVMLATWNVNECAFQVSDKLIPFTLYDVALILRLPVMGESIDCNKSYGGGGGGVVETLLVTHFKTAWPKRTKLVTLLTKPSIKVSDKVRLYMTLVLSYFLFLTTNKKSAQTFYHCLMIYPI